MFLNTLLATVSPIPLIAVGAAALVLVILIVLIVRMVRLKRRTKNLLRDNSNFVEIEAGRTKRELEKTLADYSKREHYNYASGAIPGAEPSLRFLDPARTAAPVETVKVRQTYAPSMQFPKNDKKSAVNPADAAIYSPKIVKPLDMPMAAPVVPPVLTPVPEVAPIMPGTLKTVAPMPPMPTPVSLPEGAMPKVPAMKPKASAVKTVVVPVVKKTAVLASAPTPAPAAPKPEPKPIPDPVISMEAPVEKITPSAEPIIDNHKVTINQIPVAFAAPAQKKQTKDEYSVSETALEPVQDLVIEPDLEEPVPEVPAVEEPQISESEPVIIPVAAVAPTEELEAEPLVEEMDIPSVFDEPAPIAVPVPEVKAPALKSTPAPKAEPTPAPQNPYAPIGAQPFDFSAYPSWQPPENPKPAPEAQAPEAQKPKAPIVIKIPDEIKEQYMLRAEDYE